MGGMTTQSDPVLEVESAEACRITVDSTTDGTRTQELLQAAR